MSGVAREVGVGRESLYGSLSMSGSPSFQTIVKIADALGPRFAFQSIVGGSEVGG